MRVALCSHLASAVAPTGAEHSLAQLAHGLAGRGHEVGVAVPGPWALAAGLEAAGVEMATIPVRSCWLVQYGPQPLWRQLFRAVRCGLPDRGAGRLRSWLAGLEPDVVHVNCLPHLRAAAAARACGLPVVWHVREILPPGPRRRWFAGRLRRDATRIVAVSEAVASWLSGEGLGERVEVVHNGVDPPREMLDGAAVRSKIGVPEETCLIGLFSQLVAHKGALDFVRAAHVAIDRGADLFCVIAGSGPPAFKAILAREIAAGPAADRIRLVPPEAAIWPLLAAADAVAITTLWPDPLPRVVMEAMAVGRPVVGYAGGGVPEMVVDGETGLLCAAGDTDGLAAAMVRLAADARLRERLGAAGRRRARQHFSIERHVERMESVLTAACR